MSEYEDGSQIRIRGARVAVSTKVHMRGLLVLGVMIAALAGALVFVVLVRLG